MAPELIWPFRTKVGTVEGPPNDPTTQWRRIDEGQDLQTDVGADVLAILAGTVHYAHNPSTDGGGFGATYPVVLLDVPYAGYTGYYLGHTYVVAAEGSHVAQGDVVSRTGNPGNGGTYPGWLEIGWWGPGGPVGKGGGWTAAGQDMHNRLIAAPTFGGDDLTPEEHLTLQQTHDAVARIDGEVTNLVGAVGDIQSRVGNDVEPTLRALRADFDAYVKAHP